MLTKLSNTWGNFRMNSPNINLIQQELNFNRNQLAFISSNYWLIPRNEIGGISGYFCERCSTFKVEFVRDIGYDKTAQARHCCDENEVKSKQKLSTMPSDVVARDDMWARELLNYIYSLNPKFKYLIAEDVSRAFNELTDRFDSEKANMLLGIPDRYCLYKLAESSKPDWMDRVLANLDKKIIMQEFEIIDFLKRTKSTYAVFEISRGTSSKMIKMILVA